MHPLFLGCHRNSLVSIKHGSRFGTEDANLPPHIFNASARAYQRSMTKKDRVFEKARQLVLSVGDWGCHQ